MSGWTQAMCDGCYRSLWAVTYPGREPHRMSEAARVEERCSWCGAGTRSGIYVRANPAEVPYPRGDV